jgi:hypothetical protein
VIAREDFANKVNHSTLCRFAISQGAWLPKDPQILLALGLIKERKKTHRKTIQEMNTNELLSMFQRSIMRMNNIIASRGLNIEIIIRRKAHQ